LLETDKLRSLYDYKLGIEYALQEDKTDELKSYRDQFHIPKDAQGNPWIYMTGNSLGLQPKQTKTYVNQELKDWANLGVEGHFEAKNPWLAYHEFLTESMAKIVGAKPIEVIVMNTLTANLHFMMVSFYKPTKTRYKILIESDAFPSDKYAVESQLRHHGFDDKEGLILWKPRSGETLLNYEDLEAILEEHANEIALIMIGGVNYYTGQFFDLKPPILSMAAIKASLDMFNTVGFDRLLIKSKKLTGYFEFLLKTLGEDTIKIITPSNPAERGCQLSIQVKNADKTLHNQLTKAGIISDWREPDVIRCAPVPLYNTFQDVYRLVERLSLVLSKPSKTQTT